MMNTSIENKDKNKDKEEIKKEEIKNDIVGSSFFTLGHHYI